MTARQILELRLGRPLGPIATMPRDLRDAKARLAKAQIAARANGGKPKSVRDLMAR